jgi:hypothetical protein
VRPDSDGDARAGAAASGDGGWPDAQGPVGPKSAPLDRRTMRCVKPHFLEENGVGQRALKVVHARVGRVTAEAVEGPEPFTPERGILCQRGGDTALRPNKRRPRR